ncbi:MAG: alpha/beta hydrolase, partial [Myxococcota bacterium]
NRLALAPENLVNRPRHLRLVLDALQDRGGALTEAVVIGHSFGGYTGLALAGARPVALDGTGAALEIERDPRSRGLVLLAPAVMWFLAPDAFVGLGDIPILLRYGAEDSILPSSLLSTLGPRLGTQVDAAEVAGAGHFSFQTPFPPEMCTPDFLPAQDPPNFDRAAYHPDLNDEIAAWLDANFDGSKRTVYPVSRFAESGKK